MKNWTIKDAVAVIQNGKDVEAIKEIAKHFPMFFMAVAKNDLGAVAAMMTDKMTVRRLQELDEQSDDDAIEQEQETGEQDDAAKDTEIELDDMSIKQLIALCQKRGIKVPKYGKNKQFYIEKLQGGAEDTEDAEAEDEADDQPADPYEGKKAMELYGMCKKRGIKVEPRQKAAVYITALKKADADAAEAESDDDWGDDAGDDEDEAPTKKKPATKQKKPVAKKAKVEESDDDDDWDI